MPFRPWVFCGEPPPGRGLVGILWDAHRADPSVPAERGTEPEPTWAPGADGVGPALPSPDGVPGRWLPMGGYVYDIRDDQDHPPWQEGRWAVNEWRPQTWREMGAGRLPWRRRWCCWSGWACPRRT